MRTLGQKLKVLLIGFVTVGSKFDYLTPLLTGIGRPLILAIRITLLELYLCYLICVAPVCGGILFCDF